MCLFAGTKGFLEYQGEFTAAVGYMLLLVAGGGRGVVEGTNTFFERKQGLVDLGALHTALTIVALGICSALRPCQVDERHTASDRPKG